MAFELENDSYEIHYGLYSVEEGLALSYDQAVDTGSPDVSYVLRDLTNGVRYYLDGVPLFFQSHAKQRCKRFNFFFTTCGTFGNTGRTAY